MPTPFEIFLDPVMLAVMGIYLALFLWEALFPARKLPKVKYWKLKGIAAFVLYFLLATYLPFVWDEFLASYQLIDLSGVHPVIGILSGIFVYELLVYAWHRTMHRYDVLWKGFHQVHHSAERIDVVSAFYFSPLDMAGWAFLGSLTFALVLGLPPQAITPALLILTFMGIFQHANIKTPVWLGYIIQRPESHSIHHAKGIHAYNYSDLPVFDIIFGTFRNPKEYAVETGFYQGASDKLIPMLMFKDISNDEQENNGHAH